MFGQWTDAIGADCGNQIGPDGREYPVEAVGKEDKKDGEYEKAKAGGSYEQVLRFDGQTVRHYGLNDHKEYFAEGTEAYFYRNDFYPFCRAELAQYDLTLHDLLVEVWGPLPSR